MQPGATDPHDLRPGLRGSLVFWGIGALVVLLLLAAHRAIVVLLLTFAGVLFGSAFRGVAEWFARRLRIRVGISLVGCLVVLAALAVGVWFLIAPRIAQQAPTLWTALVHGVEHLRPELEHSEVGRQVLGAAGPAAHWLESRIGTALGVLTGATAAVGGVAYVAFVTLYYAFSPETYRRGVLVLVPPSRRERARAVLATLGTMLQRWVWARLVSMVVLGIASSVALWLLGVPLALTLGLLAGLLLFIPYFGALVSAVPALLIAATIDVAHVVYVAIVYAVIHTADGYLLSPVLQKHAVRTPPVLLLAGQLAFGALWGLLGFTLATPLIAALMILVRMLYVEDILHSDGT